MSPAHTMVSFILNNSLSMWYRSGALYRLLSHFTEYTSQQSRLKHEESLSPENYCSNKSDTFRMFNQISINDNNFHLDEPLKYFSFRIGKFAR